MVQTGPMESKPAESALLEIAREFRACPIGHHSPALAQFLSHLRAGQMRGKYCLICIQPHRKWVIGRLCGIWGMAPVVQENRVFTSIQDAEWAIFKLRWCDCGFPPIDESTL